ncbi:MAG: 2-oxoacid:acceptor oxidoreductase subunit alpha [Vampirovibrionales bacterium]|nr:2-oxoacid:acceptor oxidoreductase subunit alpha [Vampirovibrionales bacterium]
MTAPATLDALCTEINWMIGGPQGTGVDSSANLFARAMAVAGYWIYGKREYHSNIKGAHSYFLVRARHTPVHSNVDPIDLLATFEKTTAEIHAHELLADGALIYDPKLTDPDKLNGLPPSALRLPIEYDAIIAAIAQETGSSPAKFVIMKNVIAVSASLALYGVAMASVEEALAGLFTGRRAKLVALNMLAVNKAYQAVEALNVAGSFAHRIAAQPNPPAKTSRMLMNGAAAVGLGKLKAGCRILTYYSITPAVDECIYLENHPEYGMVVIQCEDELAAVNMANGAATTGIRVSTSTSGPGFSLMAEGIGWAGINEVPVVIFNYQRGGPSTGLPTRSEQADLLCVVHAGHGEFPKIVMAPGDMNECFEDAFDSFNYADRYQTPVIVVPDKAIANGTESIPVFDENGLKIDRGQIVGPQSNPDDMDASIAHYPRFKITEDGVSPRVFPGTPGAIFWTTGDEHTEIGHITEDPAIRLAMHDKRMRKLDLAAREIPVDRQFMLYGPEKADITLVGWGSTKGAVLDAMPVLKDERGITMNYLHVRLMSPFPADGVAAIIKAAALPVCMESNHQGQLAQLIAMRTGIQLAHKILKYTGRPISQTEVVDAVQQVLQQRTERVVLTYGH